MNWRMDTFTGKADIIIRNKIKNAMNVYVALINFKFGMFLANEQIATFTIDNSA